MTPGPGTVALQVLLLVAGDIPLVMGRAEGSWGSSSVGALRPDPSYPPGTCRASGGHWAWPKPEQVLVGPGALLGDRLWGRQALPQLFTAWGRPVLEMKIQKENVQLFQALLDSAVSRLLTCPGPCNWLRCGSHCLHCSPG